MADRALADHLQDSGALETVWAYAAADGGLHGAEGEGASDADALRGDFDLIAVIVGGGGGVLGGVAAGVWTGVFVRGGNMVGAGGCGAGKPGGCMGYGWSVVLGVTGVVDDFFEANIVVVGGVSGRLGELVGLQSIVWLFKAIKGIKCVCLPMSHRQVLVFGMELVYLLLETPQRSHWTGFLLLLLVA